MDRRNQLSVFLKLEKAFHYCKMKTYMAKFEFHSQTRVQKCFGIEVLVVLITQMRGNNPWF